MANLKISQLPASTTLTGAEILADVQGGTTKRTTVSDISSFVKNSSGIISSSAQLPSGLVSGSVQIDYNSITNQPTTITATQASNITANNAKNSYPTGDATKVGHLTVTQAVDLDTLETNVATNNAKNSYPSGDATKVGHLTVTQAVDLDTLETDVATNNAKNTYPSGDATKVGHLTVTQAVDLDTLESNVSTNNAKVGYTDSLVKTKLDAEDVVSGSLSSQGVAFTGSANRFSVGQDFEGASTMTGSLTLSGSSSTVIFRDNAVAAFGDASDMMIYHDGNNSILADFGTGNIQIQSNTTIIKNNSGRTAITAISNGATSINHNNSLRFETTAAGVQVTGETMASGSMVHRIKTLTASDSPYDVQDTDYTLIIASASTFTLNLPLSSASPGRVLVIRTKHDSSTCNITKSGSDTIDDGSGAVSAVALAAGKARTLQALGTSLWYSISDVGT